MPLPALKRPIPGYSTLTAGISDEKLNTSPAADKWSARDNIAHLARYQIIFIERMHRILNEDAPAFEGYNGNLDPGFTPYRTMSLSDLLNTIEQTEPFYSIW